MNAEDFLITKGLNPELTIKHPAIQTTESEGADVSLKSLLEQYAERKNIEFGDWILKKEMDLRLGFDEQDKIWILFHTHKGMRLNTKELLVISQK